MEVVCFSRTFVSAYEATGRHISEQQHRLSHRHENMKSCIVNYFLCKNGETASLHD
jgi:hypothetical protein